MIAPAAPWNVPCLKDFEYLEFDPGLTCFVGENGSGKSTLMEALAVKLGMPAEGGSKHHSFSTFDSLSKLHEALIVAAGSRSTSFEIASDIFVAWVSNRQ